MEHPPDSRAVLSDYRAQWASWASTEDLARAVTHHRESRKPFLTLLDGCFRKLPKNAVVVELGCGTAIDLNLLSGLRPDILFLASDLSFEAMAIASGVKRHLRTAAALFVSDINRIPLKDAGADCVFTQGVMEHFRDPLPLLLEQARVLRPGGYLIVNVPQRNTGYTLHKQWKIAKGTWKLGWETQFSYKALQRMGGLLGLKETAVLGYGYWPSRLEPLFVLRDLVDKFYRALHVPVRGLPGLPKSLYDRFWHLMERRFGHRFMQNIVIAFTKP